MIGATDPEVQVADKNAPPHELLTEAVARPYVGVYKLEDGRTARLHVLDGFLWADFSDGGRMAFITEGPGRFYSVGLDTHLTVEGRGLRLESPGAVFRGARTD